MIFEGDYSPTPSSLIGALAINLGISVRNLSQDKEEDLRRQYFCWWSKPLPEQYSFKRILCFEGGFGSQGSQPPKVVGAVFRCLVPILSGKDTTDGSVIMPLLASGDQVQWNPALQTPALIIQTAVFFPLERKLICFLLADYRKLTMHFVNTILKKSREFNTS